MLIAKTFWNAGLGLLRTSNSVVKGCHVTFHHATMCTCNQTSRSPSNNKLSFFSNLIIYNNYRCRGSVLESTVAVGKGTSIGERTLVKQSVIGKNGSIGNDTRISNAYIWDNVVIKVRTRIYPLLNSKKK